MIAIISIGSLMLASESIQNLFWYINNNLTDRQKILDRFYNETHSGSGNGYGSGGNQGNLAIWKSFQKYAIKDDSMDSFLTTADKTGFDNAHFNQVRQAVIQRLKTENIVDLTRNNAFYANTPLVAKHKDKIAEFAKEEWGKRF